MAGKNKANEIYITRIYDAPVKLVWDAWVIPEQVEKWWGPRGFTLTTKQKDVRAGGTWTYTMHGPDGTDYPNTTKYLEVEKYRKMVYDHGGHEDRPPLFRVTVTFTEIAGKTKMELIMALATPEAAAETKKFIKKAGGDSTWDRLAEYLSPTEKFVINRSFPAPVEEVFKMFTNADHLVNWLPPAGFTMSYIRSDIKVGGTSFYKMTGPFSMYGKATYKEIVPPSRLVYSQIFCDEQEKISRHPKVTTWPEAMLTTITFHEEDGGNTRVTVQWEVDGKATAEEIAEFSKAKGGMTIGWTGSFDKLESYLG